MAFEHVLEDYSHIFELIFFRVRMAAVEMVRVIDPIERSLFRDLAFCLKDSNL